MKPAPVLLLVLALTLTPGAFASRFDLAVTVDAPARSAPGETLRWSATVENRGPDPAEGIHFFTRRYPGESCTDDVKLARLAAGERYTIRCESVLDPFDTTPIFVSAEAYAAYSSASDPDRNNDRVFAWVYLVDIPDLHVNRTFTERYVTPGLPFRVTVDYGNTGIATASGVTLTLSSQQIDGFRDLPDFCRDEGTRAVCTFPTLEPAVLNHQLQLFPIATLSSRGTIALRAEIEGEQDDRSLANNSDSFDVLTFDTTFVTNTGDSGAGSLRDAIEATNARCHDSWPCEIAFRIEPKGEPWVTIAPRSPLPPLRSMDVRLDATTQTAFFGDSNADGPEVELNGEHAGTANGLELIVSCVARVSGLAIDGFDGVGVLATGGNCHGQWPDGSVLESYIGTDPTGMRAVPNARGVLVTDYRLVPFGVADSLVSGNRYSGVFVWRSQAAVGESRIGINRALDGPLPNGASGIFVSEFSSVTVYASHVSFNVHSGISVAPQGKLIATTSSFQANRQLAIDHGLDGVTPDGGPLAAPAIDSARYDPATGITTIEGTAPLIHSSSFEDTTVSVYANDASDPTGYGEGQYFLGSITLARNGDGRFSLKHRGDLRGKWVAATTTHVAYLVFAAAFPIEPGQSRGTSEFGRSLEVH